MSQPVRPQTFARLTICTVGCFMLLAALLISVGLLATSSRRPSPPPDVERRRLPQSIVIGARKCGTRALLDFLQVHPMVRAAKEEVHYFDRDDRQLLGLAWYRSQMPPSRLGEVTVEKSPAYFVTESAPARVRRMNPRIRLILILRDPVDRVVSDYAQHVHRRASAGLRPRPLESCVLLRRRRDGSRPVVNPRAKMVHTSVYHRHLRRWLKYFAPDQIHLVDGDRLVREPHTELRLVEQFLGLPRRIGSEHFQFNATKGFYCLAGADGAGGQRCLGPEKGRRHPVVAGATINKLRAFYAEHDDRLVRLTGRRFDWMRRRRGSSS